MKIIYAKSIIEQIIDAQAEAHREGRRIEKIVLTEYEFEQFKSEQLKSEGFISNRIYVVQGPFGIYGVNIEVEKEES